MPGEGMLTSPGFFAAGCLGKLKDYSQSGG